MIYEQNYMLDKVEILLRQSDCFKLLAAFFYEPDIAVWRKENLCTSLAGVLRDISDDAAMAADRMENEITKADEKQLKIDHAALFIGPFEMSAPPYGSVYLEKTKRVMGDTTMAVLKYYQNAGLSVDVKEPPDHIALELEFLHYLLWREAEAVQGGSVALAQNLTSMREEFLSKCLAGWIPEFCRNIRRGTENRFYHDLADCLEAFIRQENSNLSIVNTGAQETNACQLSV